MTAQRPDRRRERCLASGYENRSRLNQLIRQSVRPPSSVYLQTRPPQSAKHKGSPKRRTRINEGLSVYSWPRLTTAYLASLEIENSIQTPATVCQSSKCPALVTDRAALDQGDFLSPAPRAHAQRISRHIVAGLSSPRQARLRNSSSSRQRRRGGIRKAKIHWRLRCIPWSRKYGRVERNAP